MSEQTLDSLRQEKAREYARIKRRLFFVDLALGAVFLLALLFSGLSSGLRNFLEFPQSARIALYFLIVVASYAVISVPLDVYRGFILPHRYSLSRQSLKSWLADEAKGVILGLTLGTALVVVIYLFLEKFPQTWWLLAFAFMVLITVVLSNLAPVLILPLFFKTEPLADKELRERLLSLAEGSHIKINNVFQIRLSSKTTAGNAMLMGWGNTRRIVIGDTMLQRYPPEEIEVVMAHELGHHRHGDIVRLMVARSSLMLLGFYLINLTLDWAVPRLDMSGISDVAALPLLALVGAAFALVLMPLSNAYSRHLEESADRYSLAATENPEAFAAMLTKLTDQNLAESEPSRWSELLFYDHPSYSKRMELAKRYQKEGKR
jgi:Zn-dependent protease with chaperone function